MEFQSNLRNTLSVLDAAEDRALTAVGTFCRGEMQARSPVRTGAYRDSQDFLVNMNEKKVMLGNSLDYSIFLELGTNRQSAQHVIENSVMENVPRIKTLINEMMRL